MSVVELVFVFATGFASSAVVSIQLGEWLMNKDLY